MEALEGKGVAFLGPTADTMRMFSRKHTAREFAESADVPVLPGEALHYRLLLKLHSECEDMLAKSLMWLPIVVQRVTKGPS